MSKRRLTRQGLYMMASAKAQIVEATRLLYDAVVNVEIVDKDSSLARVLRSSLVSASDAQEMIFRALDGQL